MEDVSHSYGYQQPEESLQAQWMHGIRNTNSIYGILKHLNEEAASLVEGFRLRQDSIITAALDIGTNKCKLIVKHHAGGLILALFDAHNKEGSNAT